MSGRLPEVVTLQVIRELTPQFDTYVNDEIRDLVIQLNEHSPWTYEHCLRVAFIMGVLTKGNELAIQSGLLHDIGKLYVVKSILDHPGSLSDQNKAEIWKHPVWGFQIVKPFAPGIAEIIVAHHEWQDHGYPIGRIQSPPAVDPKIFELRRDLALADQVDALLSPRPYKEGWLPKQVIEFLQPTFGLKSVQQAITIYNQLQTSSHTSSL